jgi:hypothetical protein
MSAILPQAALAGAARARLQSADSCPSALAGIGSRRPHDISLKCLGGLNKFHDGNGGRPTPRRLDHMAEEWIERANPLGKGPADVFSNLAAINEWTTFQTD